MKKLLVIWILFTLFAKVLAQAPLMYSPPNSGIDSVNIRTFTIFHATLDNTYHAENILKQTFAPLPDSNWVAQRVGNAAYIYWLKFSIDNSAKSDSLRLVFFPGIQGKVTLFESYTATTPYQKIAEGGIVVVQPKFAWQFNSLSLPLVIPPFEKRCYLVRLQNYCLLQDQVRAEIFSPESYRNFCHAYFTKQFSINLFLGFIAGGLSILSLFAFLQYLITRQADYFWYSSYLFFAILFFMHVLEMYSGLKWFSGFIPNYNFSVVPASFGLKWVSYLCFLWHFLKIKGGSFLLENTFRAFISIDIFLAIVIGFSTWAGVLEYNNILGTAMNIFLALLMVQIPMIIILLIVVYNKPIKIFFALGLFFMLCGTISSIIVNQFINFRPVHEQTISECPSLYYGIAAILESLCFALSLGYKTRELEQEKRIIEIENELEKERLKIQIARDLHDEVGSSVGSIPLFVKGLKALAGDAAFEMQRGLDYIAEITESAGVALSDTVWSIDARKENYTDLLLRIKEYAIPLAEAKGLIFHIEANLPNGKIDALLKRNIWLIVKESINNAVKYANSDRISVTLSVGDGNITGTIADNGKGFILEETRTQGNGLQNILSRARESGGKIEIKTAKGQGTIISWIIPLHKE